VDSSSHLLTLFAKRARPAAIVGLLSSLALAGQATAEAPAKRVPAERLDGTSIPAIYDKVAPAVVGISCRRPAEVRGQEDFFFGTGTIIDASGLVITSISVVPKDAREIRAYLRGGRVLPGKSIYTNDQRELSLIRLEDRPELSPVRLPASAGVRQGKTQGAFPAVPLGDSKALRLGELALTFGNAFQSIESDDQVTMGAGVVSGFYDLTEKLSQSKYLGPVLETSAPLNSGMDGGPLVDKNGALVGLLSLNYSKNRWLGTAVPIHLIKPLLRPHLGSFDDAEEGFATYAGVELAEVGGSEVRVLRVREGSPAVLAGLTAGDRITWLQGERLESLEAFRRAFARARPGDKLALETLKDGAPRRIELILWGRF
jgi:S1-C subfamily serine protease